MKIGTQYECRAALYTTLSCLLLILLVPWIEYSSWDQLTSPSLSVTASESQNVPSPDPALNLKAIPFGRSDGLSKTALLSYRQDIISTEDQTLFPRDLTFNDAKCKGERLLGLIASGGQSSKFTSFDDLSKNGWEILGEPGPSTKAVEGVLNAVGRWHPQAAFTKALIASHSLEYPNNGEEVSPTFAAYQTLYGVEDRYIVALNTESPLHTGSTEPLPDLSQWSDVTWLQWAKMSADAGTNPGELEYVLQSRIINDDTLAIIRHVGGSQFANGIEVPFPGVMFGMDTDEGRALLGTPNGGGVAWLLINHMSSFGGKTIKSVGLYSDSLPSFYFKIG